MLDASAIAPEVIRPISRVEYDHMVQEGWFENEHVELLFGSIITMSPLGPRHSETVKRLTRLLVLALRERADVFVQSSFAASDDSQPEPDLAVVPPGDYSNDHPDRALLMIEVADSSLSKDRGPKKTLYARTGIPEYWIVNLVDRIIEVYSQPAGDRYQSVTRHESGDSITLREFPDITLQADEIL